MLLTVSAKFKVSLEWEVVGGESRVGHAAYRLNVFLGRELEHRVGLQVVG